MQFTLKTVLVLFVVLASSLTAFGPFGVLATFAGIVLGVAAASKQPSGETMFRACVAAAGRWGRALKTDARTRVRSLIVLIVLLILLVLLIAPSLQTVRVQARWAACVNNLRQVGIALHNYHDDHGCFPPAYVIDKQGNRMHSWRTLLLPYFEEWNPTNGYDFNEPWDGLNNRNLAATALMTLRCDKAKGTAPTRTCFVAVTGSGTAWPGEKSTRISDFTDGTTNTILLVELADPDVHWMEPRDVTLEEALGRPGGPSAVPTSHHFTERGYFFRRMPLAGHVLRGDGSVRCLPRRLSREDLAALLSIAGGEPVDADRLLARYELSLVESLRLDHCVGLPLFIVSLVWFWIRLIRDASIANT